MLTSDKTSLPQKNRFSQNLACVHVHFSVSRRMYPQTFRLWDRNLIDAVNRNKVIGFRFPNEFPKVNVDLTLRPHPVAIEGQSPIVTPKFLSLGDSSGPKGSPILRRHVRDAIHSPRHVAWKCEPTVRLAGVDVFQKENTNAFGMPKCLPGKSALAC